MKRLGIIGGVSPESTVIYYRLMTDAVREALGPLHSLNALIYTLDYGVMISHYDNRDWEAFRAEVVRGGRALKAGGAEALIITSNTSHVAAEALADATGLPVIHMLDILAAEMEAAGVKRPYLLGTPVVMQEGFYRDALGQRYKGEIMAPEEWAQNAIGRIILNELVKGEVEDESRDELISLVDRAQSYGADGVILGCTELCMILSQAHVNVPLFDTTGLHATAAARFALGQD
jgi:aspartate racemase